MIGSQPEATPHTIEVGDTLSLASLSRLSQRAAAERQVDVSTRYTEKPYEEIEKEGT